MVRGGGTPDVFGTESPPRPDRSLYIKAALQGLEPLDQA